MIEQCTAQLSAAYINVMQLMGLYAKYLDNKDLSGWAGLFTEHASYSVASSENVSAGLPLLLINDDSKSKIEDRVRYVCEFWDGHYNDYLPRHVISAPLLVDMQSDRIEFEQNFSLYMTETDAGSDKSGMTSLLCVGHYRGEVGVTGERLQLSSLNAYLDTCVLTSALVYPV